MKNLKLIIIDKPIDHLDQHLTQVIFSRLMSLKIAYHKKEYGTATPLGQHEYVGRHIIVCEVIDGEYFPLMATRVDSQKTCDEYNIDFGPISLTRDNNNDDAFDTVLHQIIASGNKCSYTSSWSVAPEHRGTPLEAEMNSIIGGVGILDFMNSENLVTFAAGSLHLGTRKLFQMIGYEEIENSTFFHPAPVEEYGSLYISDKTFSEAKLHFSKGYASYYENRIELNDACYKTNRVKLASIG